MARSDAGQQGTQSHPVKQIVGNVPSNSSGIDEPPPAYRPSEQDHRRELPPAYQPQQSEERLEPVIELPSPTDDLTHVTIIPSSEDSEAASIELTTIPSTRQEAPTPNQHSNDTQVTYHQIPVRPGRGLGPCPVCKGTHWVAFYPLSAWLFAICLFPLGILFCLFMQRRECLKCGLQVPDHSCL